MHRVGIKGISVLLKIQNNGEMLIREILINLLYQICTRIQLGGNFVIIYIKSFTEMPNTATPCISIK